MVPAFELPRATNKKNTKIYKGYNKRNTGYDGNTKSILKTLECCWHNPVEMVAHSRMVAVDIRSMGLNNIIRKW